MVPVANSAPKFQHTAARRRLGNHSVKVIFSCLISTHSRPKAAGKNFLWINPKIIISTHSRPKAAGPPVRFGG